MLGLVLGLQGVLAQATGLAPASRADQRQDSRQQDSFEPSWRPQGDREREGESKDTEEEVTIKGEAEAMEGRSSEAFTLHSAAGRRDRHASRPGKRGRRPGATDISLPEQNYGRTGTKEGRATRQESHSQSAWCRERGRVADSRSVPAWDVGCGSAGMQFQKDRSEPYWNPGQARVENVADGAVSEEEDIDVDPEQERLSQRLQATLGFRVEGDDR